MGKRKREAAVEDGQTASEQPRKAIKATATTDASLSSNDPAPVTIQIVTGSYERVLHGFTATLPSSPATDEKDVEASASPSVQFADTFLFHAHASAIRSLALSPLTGADSNQPQKLILASGGTDERINLYSLSASPPVVNDRFPSVPTLAGSKVLENPKNRELGSLLHHSSSITALYFPSRSKLLAGAEDNTISVTRTRDWTVVSTVKAPRPKAQGRPSGDTAPPGSSPSGINDFAIHPSMKLMLSVSRGEKCMRLWNLVTGKKAGVLNFSKEILQSVKEGKRGTGEGRKIVWDSQGEEFAVAFEWGAVVFGVDSIPKCKLLPSPMSKLHRIKYVNFSQQNDGTDELLAASTEDGRIIFYSTKETKPSGSDDSESSIPDAQIRAQLGGKACGLSGRVKDFEVLSLADSAAWKDHFLLVTCGSDGAVRLWLLRREELEKPKSGPPNGDTKSEVQPRQVGKLLSTYETGNRITCMVAFVMQKPEDPSAMGESEFESGSGEEDNDDDDESSSEESDKED
ncbi:hypothetical protein VTN77DRAFT_5335 [Rasamsonia byssochlamydoides]|uniref:uncharacterized protein n=1 Tax=Rasamsonia byssochlamydoides TaxID=89139 RepID=UPI003744B111